MSAPRFIWRSFALGLKTLRPALRLYDGQNATWYAVTLETPAQLWRVSAPLPSQDGLAPTFMRTAPSVESAQRLAEAHWKSELERGLHDDAFPLEQEPTVDPRPQPFWKTRERSSIVE